MSKSCEWTGTVGTLEDHAASCDYTVVFCPKQCITERKRFSVMRKDLENHLASECPKRAHQCGYCGEEGTYVTITEDHDLLCLKKPIPCPNADCTLTVERGRTEEHVASECEHTIVACKYSNIGCMQRERRKDIVSHEKDDQVHLPLSLEKIAHIDKSSRSEIELLKLEVAELKASLKEVTAAVKEVTATVKDEKIFDFRMKQFWHKKTINTVFQAQPFLTIPNGYRMAVSVYANGYGFVEVNTYLSVFIKFLKVPYKDKLHWPFRGIVTFVLLNQLADEYHVTNVIICSNTDEPLARISGVSFGCSRFISLYDLINPPENVQYLKDDTLHFRVIVQEKNDKPWLDF